MTFLRFPLQPSAGLLFLLCDWALQACHVVLHSGRMKRRKMVSNTWAEITETCGVLTLQGRQIITSAERWLLSRSLCKRFWTPYQNRFSKCVYFKWNEGFKVHTCQVLFPEGIHNFERNIRKVILFYDCCPINLMSHFWSPLSEAWRTVLFS